MIELTQTEIVRKQPVPAYTGPAFILDADGVQIILVAPNAETLHKIATAVTGDLLDPNKFQRVAVIQA